MDLFFALSGFLITGILLDTKERPGFLKTFFARRALRIFPLYYGAVVAALFVVPLLTPLDRGAKEIQANQVWLWAHVANWPTVWPWDNSALYSLGHFWSLSVEEHFYLVWPFLVAALSRIGLAKACLAIVAVSFASRCIAATGEAPAIFSWLTITKMDRLAAGGLVAIAVRDARWRAYIPSLSSCRVALPALFLVVLALLFVPRSIMNHRAFPIVQEPFVLMLAVVGLVACLQMPANRFLTSRGMMSLGKYSYGLYVIHGMMAKTLVKWFSLPPGPLSHLLFYGLTISASFLMAYASFHLYEKHFLGLKRFFEYGPVKRATESVSPHLSSA